MFYVLFFISIVSGCMAGVVFFKKPFCRMLPVTVLSTALGLYVFALLGVVRFGADALLAGQILLLTAAVVYGLRHDPEALGKELGHPSTVLFLVLFAGACWLNHGRLASIWDEFSHWMDSVKAMTDLNGLITDPASRCSFRSYPPIMTLYQYFVQVINQTAHGSMTLFREDLAYIAYQIFGLSLLFPLFRQLRWKQPGGILAAAALLLLPLCCFPWFFRTVYIDPFVAILAGAGFLWILLEDEKDWVYVLTEGLLAGALVLAKDVGIYFALVIGVMFLADSLRRPLRGIVPLAAALAARVSWKIELAVKEVPKMFSEPLEVGTYLRLFFLGDGADYRQTSVDNFRRAFFENRVELGLFKIPVSFFVLTLLGIGLLVLAWYLRSRNNRQRRGPAAIVLGAVLLQWLFYGFNLGCLYISRFSEVEALRLASYERYLGISWLVVLLCAAGGILASLLELRTKWTTAAQLALLLGLLCLIPAQPVVSLVSGEDIAQAAERREKYEPLTQQIREISDRDAIALISQEDDGFDYQILRYTGRPNRVRKVPDCGWSVGPAFYDGDIFSRDVTAEEYLEAFRSDGFRYLAIYRTNDYFEENFGVLFADPGDIDDNTLFFFNEGTERFELFP